MALANRIIPRHVREAREACFAMYVLNKHVKDYPASRRAVYALKEAFIKALYFAEDGEYATCVVQDWRGYCFRFDVGGVTFLWHQPEITFPVELSKRLPYAPAADGEEAVTLTNRQVRLHMATVAQWLEAVSS